MTPSNLNLIVDILGYVVAFIAGAMAMLVLVPTRRKIDKPTRVPPPAMPMPELLYKDTNMIIRLAKEFDKHIRFSAPTAARFSLMAIRDSADEILANKALFTPKEEPLEIATPFGVSYVNPRTGEDMPPPPEAPASRVVKEGHEPPMPLERKAPIINTSTPETRL